MTLKTPERLAEWAGAHGAGETLRPALLTDPTVRVLATYDDAGICAGAVANRTGAVVGVSNVFSTTISADEAWAGVVATVAASFPGLPLVGYEHGDDLEPALASGFVETGPLRVWLLPE